MKVSYPNAFDKKMGATDRRKKLGYDIFIHGNRVTIGCIPIGDSAIEEVFYLVAKNKTPKTKIIIAPWDFRVRDDAPKIPGIDWEATLYDEIRTALAF